MSSAKKVGRKKRFSTDSVWAKIRRELDLTQTQLAETIGCTQPWLYQVESEKSVPSILFVIRFCRELDVDIREITAYYERREGNLKRSLS